MTEVKIRQKNLEKLRCLAMMMVVTLHFLGKGNLLGDVTAPEMGAVGAAAWVLEALCIVAVNCYMLISGYFLCESSFKLSRLLGLYLQIWMYSVGVGLAAWAVGLVPAEESNTHYFLSLLFPVSMGHYWFMTAYVFLYLLLPLVGMAVKKMTKERLKLVLIICLGAFCVLKSVLPFRLEEDGQGYDFLWYLCVFLVAAYIRKFGIKFLERRWRCLCLYLGSCAAMLLELYLLRGVYLQRGSFGLILKISFEYNHILVLLAAVGLFGWFLLGKNEGVIANVAAGVAPYVLGVYLFHENIGVRYSWQNWFRADRIQTVGQLILWTLIAVICVFVAGVILEIVRSLIVIVLRKLLGKVFGQWKFFRVLSERVKRADGMFVEKIR